MKCPADGCTRDFVTGGRRHEHAFAWGGGFELGQEVEHVTSGERVGRVTRLVPGGGTYWEVWTKHPGQVVASRFGHTSVRAVPDGD